MSVEKNIRFELIARLCPNATGAELRSVATEAGMFAIRARRKVATERDFLDSVEQVFRFGFSFRSPFLRRDAVLTMSTLSLPQTRSEVFVDGSVRSVQLVVGLDGMMIAARLLVEVACSACGLSTLRSRGVQAQVEMMDGEPAAGSNLMTGWTLLQDVYGS